MGSQRGLSALRGRYRRLSKDYELLPEVSESMIYAAMVGFVKRFVSSMKIRQEIGLHKRSQIDSKPLSHPESASSTF